MRLPVDVAAMTFIAMSRPEPVVDFTTRQPKTDQAGQPVFTVQVAAMFEEQGEILPVKVAGQPVGIEQGMRVELAGLVATPWEMGDRSGVAYRAASIRPASDRADKGGERAARAAAS
jgi:hypothetical protein